MAHSKAREIGGPFGSREFSKKKKGRVASQTQRTQDAPYREMGCYAT